MKKREKIIQKIKEQQGRIFCIEFEKKDGTLRTMYCRTGVTKFLKGGEKTYDANGAIGVYEMPTGGYKCFYPDKVISINGESVC